MLARDNDRLRSLATKAQELFRKGQLVDDERSRFMVAVGSIMALPHSYPELVLVLEAFAGFLGALERAELVQAGFVKQLECLKGELLDQVEALKAEVEQTRREFEALVRLRNEKGANDDGT